MASIGFIGLGHMGLPMAINLIKAGHQVTGFDLQPSTLKTLNLSGGLVATSLEQAAINQDLMITMLQTGSQVKQVCLELFAKANPKTLYIDCSSIDVVTSRNIHQQARIKQMLMIDAPVSGGVAGAISASLTFMVGGEQETLEKAKPFLNSMGKKIIHAGQGGNGQVAKLANNMILGISMIAISEAFTLAEQLGLAPEKLFEIVNHASGQCWALSHYVPLPNILPDVPANQNYKPGFTAAMMLKDLRLSQEAARDLHLDTYLGAQATALYEEFNQEGFGDLDFSAIIKKIANNN